MTESCSIGGGCSCKQKKISCNHHSIHGFAMAGLHAKSRKKGKKRLKKVAKLKGSQ